MHSLYRKEPRNTRNTRKRKNEPSNNDLVLFSSTSSFSWVPSSLAKRSATFNTERVGLPAKSANERPRIVTPHVAVVGATGVVGEVMRQVLAERNFPFRSIKFLASERSAGKALDFRGQSYRVEPLRPEAF